MASKPPGHFEKLEDGLAEAEVIAQLEPYIRPEKKAQVARVVTMAMRTSHSGPLPPPEDLEHYAQVVERGAERIFDMTEREQAHRHKQEDRVVRGEYYTRISGQVGAIVTVLSLVVLVAFCAYVRQPVVAGVIVAIGGAAGAFLKYSARQVDEPKQQKATPPAARKRRK